MAADATARAQARSRLRRERVLQAAIAQADEGGLDALTMRRLAEDLEFAPMALYRHVANKDDLIDGMVDLVFEEIPVPVVGADWRTSMRDRALAVRDALARHPWAIGLMESRAHPGPANLRHHDAVIGCLRAGGFDAAATAHAYSLLDSYIYGFALTKLNLPFDTQSDVAEVSQAMLDPFPADQYPHLVEFLADHVMQPGYDYADEFESGLDIVLDGLARSRRRSSRSGDLRARRRERGRPGLDASDGARPGRRFRA